jgi:hypothetical protein
MSKINWKKIFVKDALGRFDLAATMEILHEEASEFLKENVVDVPAIDAAVQSIFDKMPPALNKQTDMTTLTVQALASMSVPEGEMPRALQNVKDFVRCESKRFVETNGAEGKYVILAGAGGGVRITSPSTVEHFKKLQERKAVEKSV